MSEARVSVEGTVVGAIQAGVVLLLGVTHDDGRAEAAWLADKVSNLRIFNDEDGKMNRSLLETGGSALVISQFTLYGDARKGRRPSFIRAADGPEAEELYLEVISALAALGVRCEAGRFGAAMDVTLTNQGPVTILLDSAKSF